MGLGRESAMRWNVRKGVESEVRRIGGQRQNWVSPDSRNDQLGHALEDGNLAVSCGILYLTKSDGIYMLKT